LGHLAVLAIATIWAQAELAEIFLLAGRVALLVRAWPGSAKALVVGLGTGVLAALIWATNVLVLNASALDGGGDVLMQILLFFTKAGAFVFGSGLAIVPFLNQGVVQQYGWLTESQFLDAVAVAMVTPGPVVITVAFIGYLVAGLAGAVAASIGIFVPVYVSTIIPAPWFQRHRENLQLKAFVSGATAAATGAIAGAVVVLGQRALFDVPTVLIAVVSLGLLWRFKLTEPVLVAGAGIVGLILWPLLGRAA
jgi:chromate transporter